MVKLVMEQAPAPATPRLFLMTASAWGVVAGALLALDGGTVLASRWGGPTLALVHVFTLGFLGNAMFGSLLQFLPVAAGVRVRGGRGAALLLHALLNLGALALVAGFRWPQVGSSGWGGGLLLAAFVLLAALVLPGMAVSGGQRLLRWGLAGAVAAALVAAMLGLLLVMGRAGWFMVPQPVLANVHASWGLLGWVLALLAAVSRVVMPMFQGVAATSARAQGAWQAALYGLLAAALVAAAQGVALPGLRIAAGLLGLVFALSGLTLQWRSPRLRKAPLTGFWMVGFVAIAGSACALLAGIGNSMLVGVLALAVGLPLLVTGMQLEIVAFLGWIGLQRQCGRGVRLPGVQLLAPERDKYRVLAWHLVSALLLVGAVFVPALARAAGAALLLAHAATLVALVAVVWRGQRFIRQQDACR